MLANLLVGIISLHGLPVDEVRSVGVDQGAERLPVRPGGGHVVDVDPGVGVEEETAPLLQGLTSRQSHPRTFLLARLSSLSSLSPFAGCKNSYY